jgi:hypothetical protein
VGQLADEGVERLHRGAPAAAGTAEGGALAQPSGPADHLVHAVQLAAQALVESDHVVEGVVDAPRHAGVADRQAHVEVAVAHGQESLE